MKYPKTPEWTDEMERELARVEMVLKLIGHETTPRNLRDILEKGWRLDVTEPSRVITWDLRRVLKSWTTLADAQRVIYARKAQPPADHG